MSLNFAEKVLKSLFKADDLNEQDWVKLLDEWGGQVNWSSESDMLKNWFNEGIPPKALEWIFDKHQDKDFWLLDKNGSYKNSHLKVLTSIILKKLSSHNNKKFNLPQALKLLADRLGEKEISDLFKKELDSGEATSTIHSANIGDINISNTWISSGGSQLKLENFIGTPLLIPALLKELEAPKEIMRDWLENNKNSLDYISENTSLAMLFSNSNDYLEMYIDAGGSLFSSVFEGGDPLWLHAIKQRVPSQYIIDKIESLLALTSSMLKSDAAPEHLSREDFEKFIDNRILIRKSMSSILFEKKLISHGSIYLKSDKNWRSWRGLNSENAMLLLLAVDLRYAASKFKTKLNFNMMVEEDSQGRSLPFYYAVGMTREMNIKNGYKLGYRAKNRAIEKNEKELFLRVDKAVKAEFNEKCKEKSVIAQIMDCLDTDASGLAQKFNNGRMPFSSSAFSLYNPDIVLSHVEKDFSEALNKNYTKITKTSYFLGQIFNNYITETVRNTGDSSEDVASNFLKSLSYKSRLGFLLSVCSEHSPISPFTLRESIVKENINEIMSSNLYLNSKERECINQLVDKVYNFDNSEFNQLRTLTSKLALLDEIAVNQEDTNKVKSKKMF